MKRAIVLVLDSFGIGASHDAEKYGDKGANTFGHIAEKIALNIPHLLQCGLGVAAQQSDPTIQFNFSPPQTLIGKYGYAEEISYGKDTPSGHWEMMGVPALFHWGYFPAQFPSFPPILIAEFVKQAKLPGILANCHASGTEIIARLGEAHLQTGKPIVYTSADSVFQIAAHEEKFGLEHLYQICEIARKLVDQYHIGRVIARPFLGEAGKFYRTGNRRDYTLPPPAATLLDDIIAAQGKVIAIGKIADIFAHQGISQSIKANGHDALFDATLKALQNAGDKNLIFTNFVDFDSSYGHRRDVQGYAQALENFDRRLPDLQKLLQPDDIVIITADHGCDPTWQGSDHTREHVPILCFGPKITTENIGKRNTFADIGQSLAKHFSLKPLPYGQSFL